MRLASTLLLFLLALGSSTAIPASSSDSELSASKRWWPPKDGFGFTTYTKPDFAGDGNFIEAFPWNSKSKVSDCLPLYPKGNEPQIQSIIFGGGMNCTVWPRPISACNGRANTGYGGIRRYNGFSTDPKQMTYDGVLEMTYNGGMAGPGSVQCKIVGMT